MTTNDKLRRLRKFLADYGDLVTEDVFVITQEVDRLLAEPETQAPSEAAPPVTDADVEAAIDAVDHAAYDHATSACFGSASNTAKCARDRFAAIDALKDIIARRVQQAGAAAEDLARAVEAFFDHSVSASIWIDEMGTALAAFRAAQGGAS